MNIDLIAKMKSAQCFFENYSEGDNKKLYAGKSLLFYAVANNDPLARYEIANYLLDMDTDANGVNDCGETLLHVLFSRVKHDLPQTISLCERLLIKGVDINHYDNKHRLALQYVINMKYTDDELMPLYALLFNEGCICMGIKNDWGKTPYALAQSIPYRRKLVCLMEQHENQ